MANPQEELDALKTQLAQLTTRIYRLEQMVGAVNVPATPVAAPQPSAAPPPPVPPGTPAAAPPATPPPSYQSPHWQQVLRKTPVKEEVDLEKRIGQYWLNRVGIIAVLVGVAFFLKYAFDNKWIGETGRVVIGLLAGIAVILWSERFRGRGYKIFSYGLKAVGIGTLYLSLWAAFQLYHLVPSSAAFAAMIVVTASTIILALTQNAEVLVAFALIGGFSTPVLLSTGENHEIVLFSYVCLLDLAMLVIAIFKPWRRLLWGSFAGTLILYWGWYVGHYSDDQRALTIFFAALMASIFAAIPLVTPFERSTRFDAPSVTLTVLPLLNAGMFFLELYVMYRHQVETLTWSALILAAVYLALSNIFRRRFTGDDARVITMLHVAIAIAFITIAIPLKLNGHWITIGWLIESGALLWVGVKTRTELLRYFGAVALVLGVFRLLALDNFHTRTLIFNARFATYLVALAVLGGIIVLGGREASERERPFIRVAGIAFNVLALIALTKEASDYFTRQINASYQISGYTANYSDLRLAHDFSFSAIWMVYGAVLMMVGFKQHSAFVRWQALALMIVTIGKAFLYDTHQLGGGYRILSLIGLGVVLLGISFVYQRDWLKLSTRASAEESLSGTSA